LSRIRFHQEKLEVLSNNDTHLEYLVEQLEILVVTLEEILVVTLEEILVVTLEEILVVTLVVEEVFHTQLRNTV